MKQKNYIIYFIDISHRLSLSCSTAVTENKSMLFVSDMELIHGMFKISVDGIGSSRAEDASLKVDVRRLLATRINVRVFRLFIYSQLNVSVVTMCV